VAVAEDVKLEPAYFTNHQGCLDVLAEFGWFCTIYEGEMWGKLYGDTYWQITDGHPTPAYRHDLDGDGTEDMIVAVSHGFCVRGGPTNCSHFFLFGDIPARDGAPGDDVPTHGVPLLTVRDGIAGLVFEGNPNRFLPVAELRESSIRATTIDMELH